MDGRIYWYATANQPRDKQAGPGGAHGDVTILFGDWRLMTYGGLMWLAFHAFVLTYEEPVLAQQFGVQYEDFRANVPRWIPRLSPWRTA